MHWLIVFAALCLALAPAAWLIWHPVSTAQACFKINELRVLVPCS